MKRTASLLAILLLFLLGGLVVSAEPVPARAAPADHSATTTARLPWVAYIAAPTDTRVLVVNVRAAPTLQSRIVARRAIGTTVHVYALARGEQALSGNALWYRVSPPDAPTRYVYSRYISGDDRVVARRGKLIIVSLTSQWLVAFQDGRRVLDSAVTTGRPELPTPVGIFHVLAKHTPYTFISPWPAKSRFYYPPSATHYALQFRRDGYFIHDTPWRTVYGPGTNLPHHDPGDQFGSHGCVNVPLAAAQALYRWAGVGTTVQIVR